MSCYTEHNILINMPHSTIRSGHPEYTSSTPQFEASSSNQSQDQELQFQNTGDALAPLPFNAHGAVGSGTSTRDLGNSLQKAQENFIKSQIEVRKNLELKALSLHLSLLCDVTSKCCVRATITT